MQKKGFENVESEKTADEVKKAYQSHETYVNDNRRDNLKN
jgi:hypothetical protein